MELALSACGLVYALYRAYYGVGGTAGMIGTPASQSRSSPGCSRSAA